MRIWLLGVVLLAAGCQSRPVGVVRSVEPLSLQRDRYVLPPEPPPPQPRSLEAMRRLEAEWPPVQVYRVTNWAQARFAPSPWPRYHVVTCGGPAPSRGHRVYAARPVRANPVVVRVHGGCGRGAPPTILLEVR